MKQKPGLEFDSRGRGRPVGDVSQSADWPSTISFELPTGVADAMQEVWKTRQPFRMGHAELATDPAKHPDSAIIRQWIKDPREFDVLMGLAAFVLCEWESLPHRTQSQHRELFQRIGRLCKELCVAIDETGDRYVRGGGYGLSGATVRDLMTDPEAAEFEGMLKRASEAPDPSGTGEDICYLPDSLPRIDDLLNRVASAARRLEEKGPIHSQPTKRGAKRGFFVRRMGEFFMQRHGEQPYEVIAALTTIALGEATDRELVAKLLAPRTL